MRCSLSALRYCLNYLYKPRLLRASPLLDMLGLAQQPDGVARLRNILVQAIESLRPTDAMAGSPLWRDYEILYYRYVQHCSQEEVASQIGISVRHLKREQRGALEALADRLQEQHGIRFEQDEDESEDLAEDETWPSLTRAEMRWLRESAPNSAPHLGDVFSDVLALIGPMAQKHSVAVEALGMEAMPPLAVHATALRHILLSVLGVAIRQSSGSLVSVQASRHNGSVEIEIGPLQVSQDVSLSPDDAASLAVTRSLLDTVGGSLQVTQDKVRLSFPVAGQTPILVVDDNADLIHLLQRYAAGTRYRVVGECKPEQVFATAEKASPRAIVLDVMMPQISDSHSRLRAI